MGGTDIDTAIRLEAFRWLGEATELQGDVLPRDLLQKGFDFQGERIPLVAPQGIFKPRFMQFPLSITSTPKGPYSDTFGADGLLAYKYRGTNPYHPDNIGLRRVMELQLPMVYFQGIIPGKYLTIWPVYVVGDDERTLTFRVAVDDKSFAFQSMQRAVSDDKTSARRAYVTATTRIRFHQRSFRERVLAAYRSQCALCRLRHEELLDAAHIIPDTSAEGEPAISNGISLCKLHHAAFDSFILGVAPDHIVHVRPDVLEESDGPILKYGLQELHGVRIALPHSTHEWPSADALAWRFERFKTAA